MFVLLRLAAQNTIVLPKLSVLGNAPVAALFNTDRARMTLNARHYRA
jgi:hypothetical protein